jgi:hypothetical protein
MAVNGTAAAAADAMADALDAAELLGVEVEFAGPLALIAHHQNARSVRACDTLVAISVEGVLRHRLAR